MPHFSHFKTKNKGILGSVGIIREMELEEKENGLIKCEHLLTYILYIC